MFEPLVNDVQNLLVLTFVIFTLGIWWSLMLIVILRSMTRTTHYRSCRF